MVLWYHVRLPYPPFITISPSCMMLYSSFGRNNVVNYVSATRYVWVHSWMLEGLRKSTQTCNDSHFRAKFKPGIIRTSSHVAYRVI